jgi:hypothetical protein
MWRIAVTVTVLVAAAPVASADEEFQAQILHNDYSQRHGSVDVQIGTAYSTKFLLPLDVTARYQVLDFVQVEGRANFSPLGDIKPFEAGGGGTICAPFTGEGRIMLSENLISTHRTMVPDAGQHCLGVGGGVIYQHYAVDAKDTTPASSGTVFYAADTAILYFGLHKLMRQDVAIRRADDGKEYGESAMKKIYLEAMFAPAVHATLPAMAVEPTYRKWGGRLGIEHAYGEGSFGWAYRVEVGAFPGGGETMRIFLLLSVGGSFAL